MNHQTRPSRLSRIAALLLSAILLSLPLMIAPAFAATITVGNAGDPIIGNAANCDDASTCTLRDAIAAAAAVTGTADGDTIVFSLPADSTIILSGNELLVDRNLTIDGSASPHLAISGNNVSRVFVISGTYDEETGEYTAITVTLKRLAIRDGNIISGNGGGIVNTGDLTLADSIVSDNMINSTPFFGGGGIGNFGTLTLTNSTVSDNTVINGDGGGISNLGTLTLILSTVSDNTAWDGGGGIHNHGGTLTLTNSTVLGNTAYSSGGGIYSYGILTLTNSTLSGNTAAGDGGGIQNDSILTLTHSTVAGNTTYASGGGINNFGTLTLTDSTVSSNTAGGNGGIYGVHGGGIYNSGIFMLTNGTVSDNTTDYNGGGIYNDGTLTLTHGTLTRNIAAGYNDDIYNTRITASTVNTIIQNCAVYGSYADDGLNTKALIDNGGNLDGGSGCSFTSASSASNAMLNLSDLADNGGSTLTMMPDADSDAIGHGLPAICRAAPVNDRDQRGYVRSASLCTSGAVDPNASANDSIFFDGFGFGGQ